ncbi:integrase [Microvirga ossetica]|uniref:integrase n=1 Tax=Microvirga ossetica TaxID=1882682 RepID=UPI0012FFE30D|nr:integrase [Microvirga ossetica]
MEWQIKNKPSEDGCVWSHLNENDLRRMQEISTNRKTQEALGAIVRWLIDAGDRGCLVDYPRLLPSDDTTSNATHAIPEKGRRGEKALERTKKVKERNWQPFPDEFVSQLIWRALWMQENLGRPLLDCWRGLREIADVHATRGRSSGHPSVIAERDAFIASFDWRDADGTAIQELPFMIHQRLDAGHGLSSSWPPRDTKSLNVAVGVLQVLNLSTVAFCTGARSSELGDATDKSLEALRDERFSARTFKLVEEETGKLRDWPLHPRAVQALNLQSQLSIICRPADETHLWCTVSRGGSKLLNLTEPMVATVENLGLTELAGEDRAHVHRWRHTVAKLVALSVVGAPQVLLDLFGHRDLEMTLRYMLSDPEVAQDAMKVAKEASYALAIEAIEETVNNNTGGPAATPLKQGLEKLRMERGEEKYGVETIREAADILTFNGRHWELVRPGILCTKTLGQFGPCTQGHGEPDPGSCRTGCDHRLELERSKKHAEEAMLCLLAERAGAEAEGLDMLVANLDGQILAHLKRWPDIRNRIIAANDLARQLWEVSLAEAA